jgi:hypothetical protein
MSSATVLPEQSEDASHLSRDQWWALFDQLRHAQQSAYSEVGGPVAFLRHEREADIPTT